MLTSKQRAYLRSMANNYDTIYQIGKGGISDMMVEQLDATLEARELIKLSVLENCDWTVREAADELALAEVKKSYERLGASLDAPESLAAMNPDFTPMAKSSKRNEPPVPLTYSMDGWAQINRDMEAAVVAIADEITSGHIVAKTNAKPGATFHPCKECPYKFICRSAVT